MDMVLLIIGCVLAAALIISLMVTKWIIPMVRSAKSGKAKLEASADYMLLGGDLPEGEKVITVVPETKDDYSDKQRKIKENKKVECVVFLTDMPRNNMIRCPRCDGENPKANGACHICGEALMRVEGAYR